MPVATNTKTLIRFLSHDGEGRSLTIEKWPIEVLKRQYQMGKIKEYIERLDMHFAKEHPKWSVIRRGQAIRSNLTNKARKYPEAMKGIPSSDDDFWNFP